MAGRIRNDLIDPIVDKDFLKDLDQENQKEIFVKIATLTFDEDPIEFITGRATGGNINIDGQSSTRRTCSISLVAEELNIHDFYWGLNTKIEIFIGVKNNIDPSYPDIIWFPQGIFLITDFSTTQGTSNYTISISGRDKMSLLNGDVGGIITSLTADFGKVEEIDADGNRTVKSLPLKDIIREVVHEYAREPFKNIIIEDLDDIGLELMEYRGEQDKPMYLLRSVSEGEIKNMFDDNIQEMKFLIKNSTEDFSEEEHTLDEKNKIVYDTRTDFLDNSVTPTYVKSKDSDEIYTVIKCTYGEAIGYKETELTYAGDLIGNVGSSITQSCLDPIKNMLGNFEYFYDLEGKFHFRRKRTFVDISWNNLINPQENEEMYADSTALTSPFSYSFENANLITSFQNKPKLSNLKNDFSIWGTKKTTGGSEYPVHLRYAIDKKPAYYKNFNGEIYSTEKKSIGELQKMAKNALGQTKIEIIERHKAKKRSPEGLDEKWWDVKEWAALYRELLGDETAMPSQQMSAYLHEGDYPNLNDIFPGGIKYKGTYPIYAFDVYIKEDGSDGALAYTGHGTGCSHTLANFLNPLDRLYDPNKRTYIYNPDFPKNIQQQIDDTQELNYIKKVLHYNSDWREIIYQMARDYLKYEHTHDFLATVAKNNLNYYPTGQTGYEMYYTDIVSFWRDLYNPDYEFTINPAYVTRSLYDMAPEEYYYFEKASLYEFNQTYYVKNMYGEFDSIKITEEEFDQNEGKYWILVQGQKNGYEVNRDYFTLSYGDYNTLKYVVDGVFKTTAELENVEKDSSKIYQVGTSYYNWDGKQFVQINGSEKLKNNPNFGWNKDIIEHPSGINFWFDFLDSQDGSLTAYNVRNIGNRPKSVNDSNVKAIYYRDIPNVIFLDQNLDNEEKARQKRLKPGCTFINVPTSRLQQFVPSSQKKSAKDVLENWLYQYTTCTDSITITSLPVYYLEPNTRIFIHDENSGINGEYIIDKISYQLTYNSTMNIQATKAIDRIY